MEARRLSTDLERQLFARNLTETRQTKGAGFSETENSRVGEVHLAFGRLYGVYDDQGENPTEMIAGFVMHDLASFPQSYPKPDLTHLPPERVFECGELWAKVAGGADVARQSIWLLLGLMKAEAMIAYPIFKPWNLTLAYREHFTRVGEPIEWPYACTSDGSKIFVQAIISDGEELRGLVREASQYGFEASADLTSVRFTTRHRIFRKHLERRRLNLAGPEPAISRDLARGVV